MCRSQVSIVLESSPEDARSIEVRMFEHIQIVNWLSPTDNLIAGQWNILHVFWRLSRLDLFGPAAIALAFLDVAVLHKCILVILVKYFVSENTTTSLKLTILHDLVVNVFGISIINILLFYSLFTLVNIDVAVSLIDLIMHGQDLLRSFHFEATRLAINLLLPESDVLVVVQLDLFQFFPCALHCHFLFFD